MMLRLLNWEYAFKKWLWVDHWYGWAMLAVVFGAYAILIGLAWWTQPGRKRK